jgi:tol-pal system beta propeller repeat protein TolB
MEPSQPRQPTITTALIILAALGVIATAGVVIATAALILSHPAPADRPPQLTPGGVPPTTPTATTAAPGEPTGHIVFTCFVEGYDELCIMNADGSNQRRLTDDPATDWYASLSPDGLTIAFSSRREDNFEIYLIDAGGENPRRLTEDLGGNYAPEISPDGTRIVFVSTVNGKQDIYVMNLDGSNPARLTTDPADDIDPTWSPDGTQIAFASNRTGTNELYVMNADGSNQRQITDGSDQQEGGRSDWSPDGRALAFYAGPRGDKDIFLVPLACADQPPGCGPDRFTQLTDGGNNKAPSFSPDGAWIAFASNLTGDNDIFIMQVDGSDPRQLTDNDRPDWQPRWGP